MIGLVALFHAVARPSLLSTFAHFSISLSPSTRSYKKTIICQEVAKAKNVCQVCLLDLTYGVPVAVRDELLGVAADPLAATSAVGREWALTEATRAGTLGTEVAAAEAAVAAGGGSGGAGVEALERLAARQPYYEVRRRNGERRREKKREERREKRQERGRKQGVRARVFPPSFPLSLSLLPFSLLAQPRQALLLLHQRRVHPRPRLPLSARNAVHGTPRKAAHD